MGIIDQIAKALKEASSVAIICHTNPDPDTVCSALALYHALKYFDKENVHIYCNESPTGKVAQIEGAEIINAEYRPSYYCCVCVDCADINRLGEDIDVFYSARNTINIDHHRGNTKFAKLNYVQPYASSTCEMLYKVLLRLDPRAIKDIGAKLLYTGMVADSGAFTFPSTSNETMLVASQLMKYNFSASDICYNMIKKCPKRVFNLKLRALNNMQTYDKNTIGILRYFPVDFKLTRTSREDNAGIINEVLNIDTMLIALSITEVETDSYKVSLRSKRQIDVASVAEAFGGGGHKNAAGCQLHGKYDAIVTRLLRECRKACKGF